MAKSDILNGAQCKNTDISHKMYLEKYTAGDHPSHPAVDRPGLGPGKGGDDHDGSYDSDHEH